MVFAIPVVEEVSRHHCQQFYNYRQNKTYFYRPDSDKGGRVKENR